MANSLDSSMTPAQIFSILGPIDVAIGENVLYVYFHGLICGHVTLVRIRETVARGLQGVNETIATLPNFKTHYRM